MRQAGEVSRLITARVVSSVSDIFFVFSDRDFVKFRGIATQRLTVTKKSEQTPAGLQWNDKLLPIVRSSGLVCTLYHVLYWRSEESPQNVDE